MQYPLSRPSLFSLGVTCVSWNALQLLGWQAIATVINRHLSGDWGDVSAVRFRANALAIEQHYPLLSQYEFPRARVYVLTEDDRTRTLIVAHETA